MKNHAFCEYTYFHRVAFRLLVEKYFEGEERIEMLKRAEVHDLDKLLLYQFKEKDEVKEYHRMNFSHHLKNFDNLDYYDYLEAIIDWECARYTKPDKPYNAFDTLNLWFRDYRPIMLPMLRKLNLDYSNFEVDMDVIEELKKIEISELLILEDISILREKHKDIFDKVLKDNEIYI